MDREETKKCSDRIRLFSYKKWISSLLVFNARCGIAYALRGLLSDMPPTLAMHKPGRSNTARVALTVFPHESSTVEDAQ
jgi:hypothetical protein